MDDLREALRQAHNYDVALQAREAFAAFAAGLRFLSIRDLIRPSRDEWPTWALHMGALRFRRRYEAL